MTYNGQTVEYDQVGNMTHGPLNGGMADFTYDSRNRLIKVKEADGTTTEYEYDAENIRIAVITGGIRTEYTTDRESTYSQTLVKTEYEKNFLGQYTEQISRTTYTYGLGLISERRDDNQKYYYHYNHLGSTMAISDTNGNIAYRYVYDTYGELSDITTDDGISLKTSEAVKELTTEYSLAELADAIGIDYLYNGQYGVETDANGLYYMRARYYNQDIKRFINRDVISGDITNSQSLNRYCYVQGNPVSLTDPFGLCPTEEERKSIEFKRNLSNIVHGALDAVGLLVPGMGDMLDAVNAIIYAMEGNIDMAIISLICTIPIVGSLIGLPIKYAMKYGVDVGTAFLKFGIRNAPEITEGVSRLARAMKSKYDDASAWLSKKFAKVTPDGGSISSKYQKASLWERLTTRKANVNDLHANPLDEFSNPRIGPSESAVARYMREINATGTLSEPIEVQKLSTGGYEIVNGHHRWLAAIKTGLENVPIRIKNYNN